MRDAQGRKLPQREQAPENSLSLPGGKISSPGHWARDEKRHVMAVFSSHYATIGDDVDNP